MVGKAGAECIMNGVNVSQVDLVLYEFLFLHYTEVHALVTGGRSEAGYVGAVGVIHLCGFVLLCLI